jgi:hypothetical protein
MAKRANGIATFAASGSRMSWDFGSGVVRYDVTDNFPDFATMDDCQQRIVLNGVKQRLADCIAGLKSPTERFERMQSVAEALSQGRYEVRAAAVNNDGMLAAAIASVKGIALKKVVAYLAEKTPAQRNALAADEKYHATYLALIAERTKSVNLADLDDELDRMIDDADDADIEDETDEEK